MKIKQEDFFYSMKKLIQYKLLDNKSELKLEFNTEVANNLTSVKLIE